MARTNGRMRLISLIITLVVLFAGIVGTWAKYGTGISNNKTTGEALKKEGCFPARKAKSDIKVIESRLETIQTTQSTMRTENQVFQREVLLRLPK